MGIVYLVCIILLSLIGNAVIQKIIMDVPGSVIINGKNISSIGIYGNNVNFDVDGILDTVEENTTKFVNGVYINVLGISRRPPKVILNLTVLISCGDNKCSEGEDSDICCRDCGCLGTKQTCSNNRCAENITLPGAKNECLVDKDCDDKNPCTVNVCETKDYPNKCVVKELTACIPGDTCCPKDCDIPADTDCAKVDKCTTAKECDDNNACTEDTCSGTPKRCTIKKAVGCTLKDTCVEEGTINAGQYCVGATGVWMKQKIDTSTCKEDYECLSLLCSGKTCGEKESTIMTKIFFAVIILMLITIGIYIAIAIKK